MARAYNPERRPGETLEQHYKRLAKTADQRLVRLEKLAGDPMYKKALDYAYRTARKDLESYGLKEDELPRFNKNKPTTQAGLERKINDMIKFIMKPTSTKPGITDIYVRRTKTINEQYGTNFKWTDLATFLEHGYYDKFKGTYGSETSWDMIATLQTLKPEDLEAIGNASKATDVDSILSGIKDRELRDKLVNAIEKDNMSEQILALQKRK